jgi:deazaflavin-dependent oxidoreductase (nitroreductase family)
LALGIPIGVRQTLDMTTRAVPFTTPARLPYGPVLSRLLRPIQRGFLVVNGLVVAPALKLGLGRVIGNPITGHLMLLRTTGRRTGRMREAPLGYVNRDGAIWCVAGYGLRTPWYRNVIDEPRVEVVLPNRRLPGLAAPVDDDPTWLAGYRALIEGFGVVGRLASGDVARLTDAELLARHRSLPVVRIASRDGSPIVATRWDAGWSGVIVQVAFALLVFALAVFGGLAAGPIRLGRRRPAARPEDRRATRRSAQRC